MSASDDVRPNSGGEPATSDRNPSGDQLLRVYRALQRFAISRDCSGDYVHEQEDEILSRFTDLADALRPIRSQFGRFEGWPDAVKRDLRRLCDIFNETVRRWKWEKFAAPDPERIDPISERRLWFRENRKRPYYEAAIFAESAFDETDDRWRIRAIAHEGRELGYGPAMPAAEMTAAERRKFYYDASEAFKRRPYLSDVRPELGEQYDAYVGAWTNLRAALWPVVPAEIDPANNSPPVTKTLEDKNKPVGKDARELVRAGFKHATSGDLKKKGVSDGRLKDMARRALKQEVIADYDWDVDGGLWVKWKNPS